jgi:hypothetical protein
VITERFQLPGQFAITLDPGTPQNVWSAASGFRHLVITPTRLDPNSYSDATILAGALYTGVILPLTRGDEFTIRGQGLAWHLGDDQGTGPGLETAVTRAAGTLSQWVGDLRPSALAAGTVNNAGTTTHTATYQYISRREALTTACRAMGARWRINPNGTLDAATAANLFQTDKVVITRRPGGREGLLTGYETSRMVMEADPSNIATKVVVLGKLGDGAAVAVGSATNSHSFVDMFNNALVRIRFVDAPTEPAGNLNNYAQQIANLFADSWRSVSLSSRTYAATATVKPGDTVYVYDPVAGYVDAANQVAWRGELITPRRVQVRSVSWPVAQGMGVYVRTSGATPTYTDLSNFVQWEADSNNPGETLWEVGRGLGDADESTLNSGWLGSAADILGRTALPGFISFSGATLTASTTNPTLGTGGAVTMDYRRDGDECEVIAQFLFGTAGTAAGSGTYRLSLPFNAHASQVGWPVGEAALNDTGTEVYRTVKMSNAAYVEMYSEAGSAVTHASPVAWGVSDFGRLKFRYRVA